MFENLRIISRVAEDRIAVNLQWQWKYTPGGPLPGCNLFCCAIPEGRLLQDSVFSQSEIISWINREMIDISSPATRIENIENFYRNPVTNKDCILQRLQLSNGGSVFATHQLTFPLTDLNKVFLICVYGVNNFESSVFAVEAPEQTVPFEFVQPTFFEKLRGKTENLIKFNDRGDRRRVLITTFEGADVYSILPAGLNEYHLGKDVTPENIKEVVYLSSLIGN